MKTHSIFLALLVGLIFVGAVVFSGCLEDITGDVVSDLDTEDNLSSQEPEQTENWMWFEVLNSEIQSGSKDTQSFELKDGIGHVRFEYGSSSDPEDASMSVYVYKVGGTNYVANASAEGCDDYGDYYAEHKGYYCVTSRTFDIYDTPGLYYLKIVSANSIWAVSVNSYERAKEGYISESGTWNGEWGVKYGLFTEDSKPITEANQIYNITNSEDRLVNFDIKIDFWDKSNNFIESFKYGSVLLNPKDIEFITINYEKIQQNIPEGAESFNVNLGEPNYKIQRNY